jgi:S-DNA-T family DNA segregation ATPase FtsK/SpoIIIE
VNDTNTQLNFEADTIEEILSNFGFENTYVANIKSTSGANVFELRVPHGVKIGALIALQEEIAHGLGKQFVSIRRHGGSVTVEVTKEVNSSITLMGLLKRLKKPPPMCAVLGVDITGSPLLLRFTSPEVAHVLVAGQTGSGKTALTRSILCSLAYYNAPTKVRFELIDPKGSGFGPLVKLPHSAGPVISDPMKAVTRIEQLVLEMETRDASPGVLRPSIIVAIDELADLISVAGDAARNPITRLCQRGRECGIHVLACTQKPVASVLGGVMKANFPIKLVGSVASKGEAGYASGIKNSGAESLDGRGDFLLIKSGIATRFKSTWLNSSEFDAILNSCKRGTYAGDHK